MLLKQLFKGVEHRIILSFNKSPVVRSMFVYNVNYNYHDALRLSEFTGTVNCFQTFLGESLSPC